MIGRNTFVGVPKLLQYKEEIGYGLIALSFIVGFLGSTLNLKFIFQEA